MSSISGLNEEVLVQQLKHSLQENTVLFIRCLPEVVGLWCSEAAHRWLDLADSQAAGGQEGHRAATLCHAASSGECSHLQPGLLVSPPGPTVNELPSTSVTALQGKPHEKPHQELPKRDAGPSSPSQGRDYLHGGTQ